MREVRILSVEDELRVRESIVDWLGDSGYTMIEASDGIKGVEVFREERPDLVLLDMGLPGMNGLEVLEAIHELSPDTPVIIVSAKADISDAISAFKAGAWDYITKPIVNFDILEQTIRNCLERLDLREQVRRAQERYQRLVQNLPVIIFTLNEDLDIEFINETCETMLGYATEEVKHLPRWLVERTTSEHRDALVKSLRAALEGKPFRHDIKFMHKNGYTVYLRVHSIQICGEGDDDQPRVHGLITDVTERQFLDKVLIQREKLNTLGAIAHELAHEIRNPLMALGGFARLASKKHPDIGELEVINIEAQRIEELMNRISSYLAPVPVKVRICSVNALLTFCLDRLSATDSRQKLTVKTNLDPNLTAIKSDPDVLSETFLNVLNHITSSIAEKGSLVVTTQEIAGHAVVIFTITAPGGAEISKEKELLIVPFDGEEAAQSLAVSFRNVKNLGGHMSFEEQNGTVVYTLSLPMAAPLHENES